MADIIEMPKLSDTMTVGTLVKWLKKEGDAVATGDMLAEVETDKATMELECFFDGTLVKVFVEEGTEVELGAALCAVGEPGEEVEAPAPAAKPAESESADEKSDEDESAESAEDDNEKAPTSAPEPSEPPPPPSSAPAEPGKRVKISPLAKKLAAEKGIDPSRIKGTGTGGRIVRADVLDAEKNGVGGGMTGSGYLAKGPIQEDKVVKVSNMRATIARRLVESKTQLPHFYVDMEVDAGPLMALRAQLNEGLKDEGIKLSVNDFIMKAAAEALRKVPAVNCSWEGKQVRHHSRAHVSFAVAIDDGLITPVIFDAHVKSVFDIGPEAKTLAKTAKAGKLQPKQFTGGTFCVSNMGMMGVNSFKAIINPPNAAILAVGTTVEKPVVVNGQITIGQRMNLTLSCDHRVVDGAVGAQFLGELRGLIEKPALLLV